MAITISQTGTLKLNVDGLGRIRGGGGAIALSASGGTAPYTFTIVAGSLPPGCTLSPDGSIKAQSLHRGTALIRVRAVDSGSPPNFIDSDQSVVIS